MTPVTLVTPTSIDLVFHQDALDDRSEPREVVLPLAVGDRLAVLDAEPDAEDQLRGEADRHTPGASWRAYRRVSASTTSGTTTPRLLIVSNLDVKVVQARLRHASAKTTLDTYGHLWPDSDETTRAAIVV